MQVESYNVESTDPTRRLEVALDPYAPVEAINRMCFSETDPYICKKIMDRPDLTLVGYLGLALHQEKEVRVKLATKCFNEEVLAILLLDEESEVAEAANKSIKFVQKRAAA
jgi:hypothetical protein